MFLYLSFTVFCGCLGNIIKSKMRIFRSPKKQRKIYKKCVSSGNKGACYLSFILLLVDSRLRVVHAGHFVQRIYQ